MKPRSDRRRPRWLRLFVSRWSPWFDARGLFVTLVLVDRYDLKLRSEEGQASPAALRLEISLCRTREAIEDRLDWRRGWVFRCWAGCSVNEIATRLAGFFPAHDNRRCLPVVE